MESLKKVQTFTRKREDYLSWKTAFIAAMTIKKLGQWVRQNLPAIPTKNQKEIDAWQDINMELYSYILLTLNETTRHTITILTKDGDSLRAWMELQKLYERDDSLNIANLKDEIQSLRLEEGGDVDTYVTQHTSLVARIRKAKGNDAITKKAEIAYLLQRLPTSMRSWIYMKNAEPKLKIGDLKLELKANAEFDAVTQRSLGIETKDKSFFYSQNTLQKDSSKRGQDHRADQGQCQSQEEQREKCTYCKKGGHIEKFCRFKLMMPSERRRPVTVQAGQQQKRGNGQGRRGGNDQNKERETPNEGENPLWCKQRATTTPCNRARNSQRGNSHLYPATRNVDCGQWSLQPHVQGQKPF